MTTQIIPGAYTTYEDGHIGATPGSLSNVEAKIGAATGGVPGRVYTFSGSTGKKDASLILKDGPLLQAIEEAFDAGSNKIHAVRIGNPTQATLNLSDMSSVATLKIKGAYGASGILHFANVRQQFATLDTGYAAIIVGSPCVAVFYDSDFVETRRVNMPGEFTAVAGIGVRVMPMASGEADFWVLGVGAASAKKIIHFVNDGVVTADTMDITSLIPGGDAISGLSGEPGGNPTDGIQVVTDKHVLYIYDDDGNPAIGWSLAFADAGIVSPDVSSVADVRDLNAMLRGEEPELTQLVLDRTAKTIYRLTDFSGVTPVVDGLIDISALVGSDTPEGITVDQATGDAMVALRTAAGEVDIVLRLALDWDASPSPTATLVESLDVAHGVYGLAATLADAEITTRLTIQDRNETPYLDHVYEATGTFAAVTPALAAVINADGTYAAELLVAAPYAFALMPSGLAGPDPTYFTALAGGTDGGALSNADYLAGLEATKSKLDVSWIDAVGATSSALWNAILVHCTEMEAVLKAERFAILRCPAFVSSAEIGSAAYLEAVQAYVDAVVLQAGLIGDRNAVIFAGDATYLGSDGVEYNHSVVAGCGGTMAGLPVQKSLINKPVRNALAVVPEFGPGHIESLIQARVNAVRLIPGRGFCVTHSLTAAAVGSDYSRVNDLRAVYYGAKAAREAAQPYIGEENDSAGEGLLKLESAMKRPLEKMKDTGQIDTFVLRVVSTPANRLLGEVYATLGIQPLRAMEMIYTTVYLA